MSVEILIKTIILEDKMSQDVSNEGIDVGRDFIIKTIIII